MVRYKVKDENVAEVEAGQENLKNWVDGSPPAPEQVEVVGSHNLF